MPKPSKSPAVQAYYADKARQESHSGDDQMPLRTPSRHPTRLPLPTARRRTSMPNSREPDGDYPLVDHALRSTGAVGGDAQHSKIPGLRHDASRISDQASEVASGAASLAKAEARSIFRDIEARVRERPLTAVGIVAAIAFVWGAAR